MDVQDIILAEVRNLATKVDEGFKEVVQRTSVLETQVKPLFPNGNKGTIKEIQDDIEDLQGTKKWAIGFFAGLVAIEGTYHWVLHHLGFK